MRLLRFLVVLLAAASAAAQPHLDPHLVKDLNTTAPDSSSLSPSAAADSYIFLEGSTLDAGYEPSRTDGTAEGTSLLRDIYPGGDSYPFALARAGDTILFAATDPMHGRELWCTDGTPAGTRLVADIRPGPGSSIAGGSILYRGKLLFAANDGVHGNDLWTSDGTRAGTSLLADLPPGLLDNTPLSFALAGDRVVFGTNDGLWITDGSAAGTKRVGTQHGYEARSVTVVGSNVFFSSGDRLWTTNLVTEPVPLTPDRYLRITAGPFALGNRIVFFRESALGIEPWVSDGTPDGTKLLRDVYPGTNSSIDFYGTGVVLGGILYFVANDGVHGKELWRTDGTPNGTALVKDINPGQNGSFDIYSFYAALGRLWLTVNNGTGYALWTSDGTDAGTKRIATVQMNSTPVEFRGKVYFRGYSLGSRLWVSDGTPDGTQPVPGLDTQASSNPRGLVPYGTRLYFSTYDALSSSRLWTTDGTDAGTRQLSFASFPSYAVSYRGSLYLASGRSLYRVDGDAAPVLVKEFPSQIGALRLRAGLLYINAGSESLSDGTAAGTIPMPANVPPSDALEVAGRWLQLGFNSLQELTFGAPARPIKTLPQLWSASRLADLGGVQAFVRWNQGKIEIWRSDGSAEGTFAAASLDANPSAADFSSSLLTAAAGRLLYFELDDGVHGLELWRTDGTAGGTFRLGGALPYDLTPLDERLFFTAEDENYVRRLWVTDGTTAGTRVVAELGDRATIANLTAANGVLFFTADDGLHGIELWETDGTAAGTHLYDVEPGPASSAPQQLTAGDDKLFFTARTTANGRELWALPLTRQTVSIGDVRAGRDAASATLTVSIDAPARQTIAVDWTTVDNVARAGADYVAASGTLLFAPGEQQKTIAIALIPNAGVGGNRPLNVRLTAVRGATAVKSLGTILIEQRLAADLEVTMALATTPDTDAADRVVTIRNLGPSAAVNVQLTVRRDPPFNDDVLIPEIAAGATFTKVIRGASVIGASASSAVPDPNPANNAAVTTRIAGGPFGLAISIEPGTLAAGAHGTLVVVHRGDPPGPKDVRLTSTNPAVIAVPASVTVDATHPASIAVVAASAGTTDIRATDGYALVVLHLEVPATHARWDAPLVLSASYSNQYTFGNALAYDAYVAYRAPDTGAVATGTVTFSADGRFIGIASLDAYGSARGVIGALTAGTHKVAASYSGDANFLPGSASQDVTIYRGQGVRSLAGSVRRIDAATAEIRISVNGSPGAAPTGTITVTSGSATLLDKAPLVNGSAAATVPLLPSVRDVAVAYSGDSDYLPYTATVTLTPARVRVAP